MQKKIIALAIAAGMSGAAFAQSNVTISGAMELHYENVSAKGATVAGGDLTSRTRVTNNTSWVRLSGTEKLGNGMEAFFQIEQDVNGDTGAATGWSSRNTAVGLKGTWGTALLGRWDAHYQAQLEGGVDFGSSGALPHAANSMNLTSQVTTAGVIGGRLDNVVAYITPDFNGLTARFAYTAGSETTTAGMPAKDSGWNLFARYANGPINAFWSHLKVSNNGAAVAINGGVSQCMNNATGVIVPSAAGTACAAGTTAVLAGAAATSGNDVKSDKLGLAYSFPMGLKAGLVYDTTTVTAVGTGLTTKRNAWSLPISYMTGNHGFYFAYAKASDVSGSAIANGSGTGAKNTILGYTYALSKRTSVGASWSRISNDANARYDFWTRNVSGSATGLAAGSAGADPTSFAVGINHGF